MPHGLAVEAVDLLLALEAVRPLVAPSPVEASVLEAEASEAAPATGITTSAPPGPAFLLLLLLVLLEGLNFLFLLLIPSQVFLDKIIQGWKAKFVSNLQFVILIVYLFLALFDQTFYLLRKTFLKMLLKLHFQVISPQVFNLGIKLELGFTA